MPPKKFICPRLAHKHLNYDPVTGQLSVKTTTRRLPLGHVFTTKYPNHYIYVTYAGFRAAAHRVAWVLMTGKQPDVIDHINRVRHDNRWENLRDVTHAENMQNKRRIGRIGVANLKFMRSLKNKD